jgi:uncharacterized protein (UPF0264 family)
MSKLLVSVRSAAEAEAALAGGAAVIDIKEPADGSLGRASERTVAEVLALVAGRRPVTAALGELVEGQLPFAMCGLTYAKWGLAGLNGRPSWKQDLITAQGQLRQKTPGCALVAVAYADWQRADAPPPEQVCTLACTQHFGAFLIDTWRKGGTSLLDWLSTEEALRYCQRCRVAGVRVALAGSLRRAELVQLRPAAPDWFAVRGAVCREGDRGQSLDADAVRSLVDLLHEFR